MKLSDCFFLLLFHSLYGVPLLVAHLTNYLPTVHVLLTMELKCKRYCLQRCFNGKMKWTNTHTHTHTYQPNTFIQSCGPFIFKIIKQNSFNLIKWMRVWGGEQQSCWRILFVLFFFFLVCVLLHGHIFWTRSAFFNSLWVCIVYAGIERIMTSMAVAFQYIFFIHTRLPFEQRIWSGLTNPLNSNWSTF